MIVNSNLQNNVGVNFQAYKGITGGEKLSRYVGKRSVRQLSNFLEKNPAVKQLSKKYDVFVVVQDYESLKMMYRRGFTLDIFARKVSRHLKFLDKFRPKKFVAGLIGCAENAELSPLSVSGIIGDFKRSEGYIEKDIKTFIENSKK